MQNYYKQLNHKQSVIWLRSATTSGIKTNPKTIQLQSSFAEINYLVATL